MELCNMHFAPDHHVRRPSPQPSYQSSRSNRSGQTLESDQPQPPEDGDEDTPQPTIPRRPQVRVPVPRDLTSWDVCAFIINKMIGTGIFTGPPAILMYTGSKSISLGLWASGFVYTLLSMIVYLQFARKLPYTGGQLIYLDAILPRPILLAYTCYSLYFVSLYTTATSSMQFASQVIMAATKSDGIPDQRVMRLIVVAITSLVCLVLYFSTAMGRKLNRYSAFLKIILLMIIIVAGGNAARKSTAPGITWKVKSVKSHSLVAFLQVLYAFQGWENATLVGFTVAGEIPNYKVLRRGFIAGVFIVGTLYMSVNLVYCYAISWGPNDKLDLQFVPLFFGNSERAQVAWNVVIALSSFGSNISITYTCVRVKQTLAWSNILPWSTFWRKSAPIRNDEPRNLEELQRLIAYPVQESGAYAEVRTGAPQGGIALHWAGCIFHICVSSAVRTVTEAISLPGLILIYGQAVFGIATGLLFPRLLKVLNDLTEERGWNPGDPQTWLKFRLTRYSLGYIYAGSSAVIVILSVFGPNKNTDGSEREVKGWWFPAITFSFLAFSVVYYLSFIASENINGAFFAGVRMHRRQHGIDDREQIMRQCDQCMHDESGTAHRHTRDGYLYYNDFEFANQRGKNLLYWIFGGPKKNHYPNWRLGEYVGNCLDMMTSGAEWVHGTVRPRKK